MVKNAWQVEHGKQSSGEQSCAQEDLFKIDLHGQGVPQNAVLEDQGRMIKIRDFMKTLRTEYRRESVIADLSKTGELNTFSEESKKTINNFGQMELLELGEVSTKIQCPSCAKYWPQGVCDCTCGTCFRPSKEQMRKIKDQFEILSIPYYIVKILIREVQSMD